MLRAVRRQGSEPTAASERTLGLRKVFLMTAWLRGNWPVVAICVLAAVAFVIGMAVFR